MVGITGVMMNDTSSDASGGTRDTMNNDYIVREGDYIFLLIDRKRRYIVRVEKGKIFGTDKGYIKLDEVIGKPYGSTIKTSLGYKAYILKPLHHDILYGFKRVTQVIYPKDSSFMIFLSGIKPGSHVAEAGIGTGYLATYIATIIGSSGKLYAYDVRDDVLEAAKHNLEKAGLLERVVLKKKDVREGIDEKDLDAIFLDIPDPWNVVDHAYSSLKPSATLVVYVPTINQVEKTVLALKKHGGFTDICSYEILLREYQVEEGAVRPHTLMIGHTGYIVFSRKILRQ